MLRKHATCVRIIRARWTAPVTTITARPYHHQHVNHHHHGNRSVAIVYQHRSLCHCNMPGRRRNRFGENTKPQAPKPLNPKPSKPLNLNTQTPSGSRAVHSYRMNEAQQSVSIQRRDGLNNVEKESQSSEYFYGHP